MKKPTVGKSEQKMPTIPLRQKQPLETAVNVGVVESVGSPSTGPAKKDRRRHHGYKPCDESIKPETIIHSNKRRTHELQHTLETVIDKAREGDSVSVDLLVALAFQAILGLMITKVKHLTAVNDVAKKWPFWPVLILEPISDHIKSLKEQLSGLELGAHILDLKKETTNPKRVIASSLLLEINRTRQFYEHVHEMSEYEKNSESDSASFEKQMSAYHLRYEKLNKYNRDFNSGLRIFRKSFEPIREQFSNDSVGLPELSAETCGAWFDVAWKLLLYLTDECPEDNEMLAEIGSAGKTKYDRASRKGMEKTSGFKDGRRPSSKKSTRGEISCAATIKSNVRYEIMRNLKNSFKICCALRNARQKSHSQMVADALVDMSKFRNPEKPELS